MLNNYSANPITNNIINAVSGNLTKTFRKSYFVRFQQNSPMEEKIFDKTSPYISYKDNNYEIVDKKIVVLQVMLCKDKSFLCEIIDKKDYDEMFIKEVVSLSPSEIERLTKENTLFKKSSN